MHWKNNGQIKKRRNVVEMGTSPGDFNGNETRGKQFLSSLYHKLGGNAWTNGSSLKGALQFYW